MRANTDRAGRFNFDSIALAYDAARLPVPADLIADASATAGFTPGGRALEIGAGTGQLTGGLVDHGWTVTAIEPGQQMREVLASKLDGEISDGRLSLSGAPFEEYAADGLFDSIWSANAFHWVDPAVSYPKSADLLTADGHLVLVWTFTMAEDDVQAQLNEQVFASTWPGLVRAPDGTATTDVLVEQGCAEWLASGRFVEPAVRQQTYRQELTAEQYTELQLTFGDMTTVTPAERADLLTGIRAVADKLTVCNVTYACTAAALRS